MVDGAAFLAQLDAHGVAGALLVHPSAYGFDNRAMLDAIDAAGGRFKGIAVLDPATTTRADLVALKARGVVGLRFIVAFEPGILARDDVKAVLRHLAGLDMFAQVMVSARDFEHALPTLEEIPVKVVFDHIGWPDVRKPVDQPKYARFLAFGRHERAAVKISNLVRISREPYPFDDVAPFVDALLDAFTPARCVWGSDSPFIHVDRDAMDYGRALGALTHVVPDASARQTILVEAPRRLFGFA